jgi:hypothetical protein
MQRFCKPITCSLAVLLGRRSPFYLRLTYFFQEFVIDLLPCFLWLGAGPSHTGTSLAMGRDDFRVSTIHYMPTFIRCVQLTHRGMQVDSTRCCLLISSPFSWVCAFICEVTTEFACLAGQYQAEG